MTESVPDEPATTEPTAAAPPRLAQRAPRRAITAWLRRLEPVLVVLVSLAVLAPGISGYSLVDPWETHYGEVSREMLQDNDFVQTKWDLQDFLFVLSLQFRHCQKCIDHSRETLRLVGNYRYEFLRLFRQLIVSRQQFCKAIDAGEGCA